METERLFAELGKRLDEWTFPLRTVPLRLRVFLERLITGELDMKRKQLTEEQIVGVLREQDAGG